jgi:CelD/BcsL family acetyltransferase involved in cellulose biosynthesis
MIEIELSERVDFDRLGEAWTELEGRADASFFQSWSWVGCLAPERFPQPVLLEARADGVTVALGLFNRRRRRVGQSALLLNESGVAQYDAVFVEHNGFLVERGRPGSLIADCLRRAATFQPRDPARQKRHRLVLSGMPETYIAAAKEGPYRHSIRSTRAAPFVDLLTLRTGNREYLGQLSANTRYQLRRSQRRYGAIGSLAIRRAGSIAEAIDFLAQLADLHQRYWTSRGRPGAFANDQFGQFHRALIERAFPAGGVDLLRISAGERVVGYLYNLRYRGNVYAYQSGFDYAVSDPHQKPGLTCHHLAIERYLAEGADRYDLLAGADRYKQSLATGATMLHWLEIGRRRPLAVLSDLMGVRPVVTSQAGTRNRCRQ